MLAVAAHEISRYDALRGEEPQKNRNLEYIIIQTEIIFLNVDQEDGFSVMEYSFPHFSSKRDCLILELFNQPCFK